MKEKFGLAIKFTPVASCDNDKAVQEFIRTHHKVPILFDNVCDLGGQHAKSDVGDSVLVPRCCLVVAGIECDTIADANNFRAQGSTCVEDETGKTGTTWGGFRRYVKSHRPAAFIIENVRGILKPQHLNAIIAALNEVNLIPMRSSYALSRQEHL